MAKTQFLVLTQGEILLILAKRDTRSNAEIAALMGFSSYTYLSRLFNKQSMPDHLIKTASQVSNVHPDIFQAQTIADLQTAVEDLQARVSILEAEKAEMSASLTLCHTRLDNCEREKRILTAKNN